MNTEVLAIWSMAWPEQVNVFFSLLEPYRELANSALIAFGAYYAYKARATSVQNRVSIAEVKTIVNGNTSTLQSALADARARVTELEAQAAALGVIQTITQAPVPVHIVPTPGIVTDRRAPVAPTTEVPDDK